PADVVIDVGDHAEELGHVRWLHLILVPGLVLGSDLERAVWGVGGEVTEERLAFPLDRVDPPGRLLEEDVGAVAAGPGEPAVVENGRVEVGVARGIAATAGVGLADAAGTVDEHLVESAVAGPPVRFITQVPLAEDAGRVPGGLQHLGEGGRPGGKPLPLKD